MFVIADVLSQPEVAEATRLLAVAEFVDGRTSAGWHARLVKHNEQARTDQDSVTGLMDTIRSRLLAHPVFQMAARPKTLTPLLLSRYTTGMHYGSHVDNAIMHGLRTDLSFTLFLSAPDSYAGGALVIDGTGGEDEIRLPAGSLVLYPSTALHRVTPIERGQRFAAVGWVRSYVRDASHREILFDLDSARQALFQREGKTAEFDLLSKTSANLLRLWVDD